MIWFYRPSDGADFALIYVSIEPDFGIDGNPISRTEANQF